ncbi:HNH endonuclease [Rhodococcus rhodnii]|uniref:HNH endonuclease n=3 Tax=Rhodococcus rhodnii TaxID=38312 RepID=A0A6P2CII9_9NOCA|nr:HNH endonuclease signature motif containing protein [Rhodococcus rhodnii]TXG92112.1 HNH endonuclease [Rhodococcus rhodnii]
MGSGDSHTAHGAPWQLGDGELRERALSLSRQIEALQAQRISVMGEVVERGISGEDGYRDAGSWLAARTMLEVHEARRVVNLAVSLRSQPEIAAAVAEQRVSPTHAQMICDFFETPPSLLAALAEADPEEHSKVVEFCRDALLAAAVPGPGTTTASVRRAKERLEIRLDAESDGPPTRERDNLNHLSVSHTLHGRVVVHGNFDALSGEVLMTALSKLSAPQPAEDGTPDRRSPRKRRADALVEVCRRFLDSGVAGMEAGEKPHVTVLIHQRDLQGQPAGPAEKTHRSITALLDGIGLPWTPWGATLTPETARAVACDAQVTPIVIDDNGVPLSMGRTTRLVTPAQRRALTVRDRGCAFPNCTVPSSWCEAHHITHWADGGPTDLDNMVLLCGSHHRHVHHSDWTITSTPRGRPTFTPPGVEPPGSGPPGADRRHSAGTVVA